MQLLESEDKKLIGYISQSDDIVQMVKSISDKDIGDGSDEDDGDDGGEGEVIALSRRCLELLGAGPKQTLVEA